MKVCSECDTKYQDYLKACPVCGKKYVDPDDEVDFVKTYQISKGATPITSGRYVPRAYYYSNQEDLGSFGVGVALTLLLGVIGMAICLGIAKHDTCKGGLLGFFISLFIGFILVIIKATL